MLHIGITGLNPENITILAQDKPNIEIPLVQEWLTILYQDYLLIGISIDQYWHGIYFYLKPLYLNKLNK